MLVSKQSPLSGKINTLEIPVTQEQLDRWQSGRALIQNVMPHLTDDQREFLMTGYTAEDWEKMFPPEEEDDKEMPF
jgi:hypothetical protein